MAEQNEPSEKLVVHLLDDGFQHRQLARDVDIGLLTQADVEDSLLPAGNLREPLRSMRRAHVAVLREEDGFTGRLSGRAATWFVRRKLCFVDGDMPRHPLAFCGLARPEGFFAMLKAAGIEVAATSVFRDHHAYGDRDIEQLLRLAQDCGADGFVTSEKDAVKLSAGMMKKLRSVGPVAVPGLEVELLDESAALKKLMELVARKAS